MQGKRKVYREVERQKEFLAYMVKKYKPICPFCHKPINWEDLYPRKYGDKQHWTIHHVNLNHDDNRIENQILCHRGCHRKYHKNLEKQRREVAK